MKAKRTIGVLEYLDACGVLSNGTPEQIAVARKEYWKAQKRKWKQKHRRNTFEVVFTDDEMKIVERNAAKLHVSRTRYIRVSAVNQAMLPDLGTIREVLFNTYNLILKLSTENAIPQALGFRILQRVEQLEQSLSGLLSHFKQVQNDR